MSSKISWQDDSPEKLLIERFHITTGFRPRQRDIIEKLVNGKRVVTVQSTGWGKSLCYQMASLYYPHLTVVFSPLKAFMRDQSQHCDSASIPTAIISSDFDEANNLQTLQRAINGDFKILFISPERLNNQDWINNVIHLKISMIVIDEAHCISIWGHDFRPDYRRIVTLLTAIPQKTPVLALTATANTYVEEDILQQVSGAQIIRGKMLKPKKEKYLLVLSSLCLGPLGLHDIMRRTGISQTMITNILADLEENGFIGRQRDRKYVYYMPLGEADFHDREIHIQHKEQELRDMIEYAGIDKCYMNFLATYLGDRGNDQCGVCSHCQKDYFQYIVPTKRMQQQAIQFIEEDFLPTITKSEKSPTYETGCSLSYYGKSHVGDLVRLSKYQGGGPFNDMLVQRAVDVIRVRYPLNNINGIVSVPSTRSGSLVSIFAQSVADRLHIEYIAAISKSRSTQEQKNFTNWVQKKDNVKDAFSISQPEYIAGRCLLLIDDIYDSGYTLREVSQRLRQAGAQAVYPFTIARTLHSDDQ